MKFVNEYDFLSNFYILAHEVVAKGHSLPTVEHAFQMMKCTNQADRNAILTAKTPGEAKRRGSKVALRLDWEDIKLHVMHSLVEQKFRNNPILWIQLMATSEIELVEENQWGDTYWGVCDGLGCNHLGNILMTVREMLTP